MIPLKDKEKIKKKVLTGQKIAEYRGENDYPHPGPGEYDPMRATNRLFDKKPGSLRGNSYFLESEKRFQYLGKKKNFPGPGHYKKKGEIGDVEKYEVFGAVFMSEQGRGGGFDGKKGYGGGKGNDGLGVYDGSMKMKKSDFHFNLGQKFVV